MATLHGELEYSNELWPGVLHREQNVGITDITSLHINNEKVKCPQSMLK